MMIAKRPVILACLVLAVLLVSGALATAQDEAGLTEEEEAAIVAFLKTLSDGYQP